MKQKNLKFQLAGWAFMGCLFLGTAISGSAYSQDDAAVKRAKREALMLDDIYKNGIVLITKHYVNDKNDLAAGEAFKKLFEAAEKKGWHKVRLLDATDEPYNDENAPQDKFEKAAIKELLSGKPIYDQIVKEKGKRFLRRATAVPVVMKKCVMCHSHYADVAEGKPIGAISYTIPIIDE